MEIALVSTTARRRFTLISPDMVKDRVEHNISARGSGQKLSSQHLDSRTVGRGILKSHKRILMKKVEVEFINKFRTKACTTAAARGQYGEGGGGSAESQLGFSKRGSWAWAIKYKFVAVAPRTATLVADFKKIRPNTLDK